MRIAGFPGGSLRLRMRQSGTAMGSAAFVALMVVLAQSGEPTRVYENTLVRIAEPQAILADHPQWVPPLRIAVRDALDKKSNPFYRTADRQLFLAVRDGRPVGRIAAIENRAHNDFYDDRIPEHANQSLGGIQRNSDGKSGSGGGLSRSTSGSRPRLPISSLT